MYRAYTIFSWNAKSRSYVHCSKLLLSEYVTSNDRKWKCSSRNKRFGFDVNDEYYVCVNVSPLRHVYAYKSNYYRWLARHVVNMMFTLIEKILKLLTCMKCTHALPFFVLEEFIFILSDVLWISLIRRNLRIVEMPKDHHRTVFCTSHAIKLIVVTLGKSKKTMACVKKITGNLLSVAFGF